MLSSLPLVEQGLIRFELIPLVAYPGFARLFEIGAWQVYNSACPLGQCQTPLAAGEV